MMQSLTEVDQASAGIFWICLLFSAFGRNRRTDLLNQARIYQLYSYKTPLLTTELCKEFSLHSHFSEFTESKWKCASEIFRSSVCNIFNIVPLFFFIVGHRFVIIIKQACCGKTRIFQALFYQIELKRG